MLFLCDAQLNAFSMEKNDFLGDMAFESFILWQFLRFHGSRAILAIDLQCVIKKQIKIKCMWSWTDLGSAGP